MHGRFDECLEIICDIPVPVQQDGTDLDNFHVIAGYRPLVITRRLDVYGQNKRAAFLLSFFHDSRVVDLNITAIKYISALSPGSSPSQLVDGRPNVCGDWFLVSAERASFLTNFTEDQGCIDPTKTECIRNNMMHVFRACSITHEVEISGLFHRIVDVETGWQDLIA